MSKFSISKTGVDLIKSFEGLKLHSYLDDRDPPVATIGWGTTFIDGKPVVLGMKITKERADELLLKDLAKFEKAVNQLVKAKINQKMFDALVSFVYNVGEGSFKGSTLLKLLNQKKYEECADQFLLWRRAGSKILKGLERRRQKERQLFLSGVSELVSELESVEVENDET